MARLSLPADDQKLISRKKILRAGFDECGRAYRLLGIRREPLAISCIRCQIAMNNRAGMLKLKKLRQASSGC